MLVLVKYLKISRNIDVSSLLKIVVIKHHNADLSIAKLDKLV